MRCICAKRLASNKIMETESLFIVSPERLKEHKIEPATLGLLRSAKETIIAHVTYERKERFKKKCHANRIFCRI